MELPIWIHTNNLSTLMSSLERKPSHPFLNNRCSSKVPFGSLPSFSHRNHHVTPWSHASWNMAPPSHVLAPCLLQ